MNLNPIVMFVMNKINKKNGHWNFVFPLLVLLLVNLTTFAQTSKKVEKWFEEAKAQQGLMNYTEAVTLCNKILKDQPDFADAHLLLADVYDQLDSTRLEIVHIWKKLPR